mgnify:CR=1 FL=1
MRRPGHLFRIWVQKHNVNPHRLIRQFLGFPYLLPDNFRRCAGCANQSKMLERVKEIIQEQLNLDGVEITEDSSFKDDLGVDSLDLFELVMAFEEEYKIEIPSEDLEQITTVGAVIEYMKNKGVEA